MALVYLDTSALIKLCVHESGSPLAVALWEGADALATSRLADTEVRAVIAAGERIGRIDVTDGAEALARWEELSGGLFIVELTDAISERASAIVKKRPLRAADAIHLASALTLKHPDLLFAAWDRNLANAGRAEGLTVLPPGGN